MRGGAVQIVVALLNVLAMIALVARQAEEPLFQDRIAPIPHGDGEADVLMPVADSRDTVLVPPVGSGSRVIVRKILPGVAIRAVVLSDRSPGALAQVRAPALPMRPLLPRLFQSELFVCHLDVSLQRVNKGHDHCGLFPLTAKNLAGSLDRLDRTSEYFESRAHHSRHPRIRNDLARGDWFPQELQRNRRFGHNLG